MCGMEGVEWVCGIRYMYSQFGVGDQSIMCCNRSIVKAVLIVFDVLLIYLQSQ